MLIILILLTIELPGNLSIPLHFPVSFLRVRHPTKMVPATVKASVTSTNQIWEVLDIQRGISTLFIA